MSVNVDSNDKRTVFAGVIAASAFAALAIVPDTAASQGLSSLLRLVLVASGSLAFLFILTQAASLKYKDPEFLGPIRLSDKLSEFLYNYAIDIYGIAIVVAVFNSIQYFVEDKFGTSEPRSIVVALFLAFSLMFFYLGVRYWKLIERRAIRLNSFWRGFFVAVLVLCIFQIVRDMSQVFGFSNVFTEFMQRPHDWCGSNCNSVTLSSVVLTAAGTVIILVRGRAGWLGPIIFGCLPLIVAMALLP